MHKEQVIKDTVFQIKKLKITMLWLTEKNVFGQPIKNDKVTCENIRKIATGQGDDYTTVCLLDYIYFKKYYKMIAADLSKQQVLDADPKGIQQINFTANLDIPGRTRIYLILEEAKQTVFDFSQGTVKVL